MASSGARVDVQTLKVEDLLRRLKDGSIRVPTFQRGLKWKREDNRLFFDSLVKGYPVGSLLMWVRDEPAGRVTLGPFEVDAIAQHNAWRVIDGQQRLTALAGGLLSETSSSDFRFVVDIDSLEIASPRKLTDTQVPLSILADTEKLLPWLYKNPKVDVGKATRLSKAVREYPLSAAVLTADDQGFVEEVFTRLNERGKRLTRAEVFKASQHRSAAGRGLEAAIAVGKELKFGSLDESNVLRALKALNGHDPLSDAKQFSDESAERLVAGAKEAVILLKATGVPTAELLPYSLPMGVLIAFLAKHSNVTPRTRVLLEYWFWRATLSFSMKGEFGTIRDLYDRATSDNEHEAMQRLLQAVPDSPERLALDDATTWKTAAARVIGLILVSAGPRDLKSGEPLDLPVLFATYERSRLFFSLEPEGEASHLWTMLHPRIRRANLKEYIFSASPEVLRSHLFHSSDDHHFDELDRRQNLIDAYEAFSRQKTGVGLSTRSALIALGDPNS
jgi:hypothetical protein